MTEEAQMANKVMKVYRDLVKRFPHVKFGIESREHGEWWINVYDLDFYMRPLFTEYLDSLCRDITEVGYMHLNFIPCREDEEYEPIQ